MFAALVVIEICTLLHALPPPEPVEADKSTLKDPHESTKEGTTTITVGTTGEIGTAMTKD